LGSPPFQTRLTCTADRPEAKRQNRLDFALAEVGRIERTLFTLDWLESPTLRRACQAGR